MMNAAKICVGPDEYQSRRFRIVAMFYRMTQEHQRMFMASIEAMT